MASCVGPAVTSTFIPVMSFLYPTDLQMYWNKVSGSGIFPAPLSPQARWPVEGVMTSMP